MANTFVNEEQTINISSIDSNQELDEHYIKSIIFFPGAIDDIAVFKDTLETGAIKFPLKSADGYPVIAYVEQSIKLFLDFSACTFTAGAYIVINKGFSYAK